MTYNSPHFHVAFGITKSLALIINMIEEAAKGNNSVPELAKSSFADYTGALIKANTKLGLQGCWAESHRQCSQCVGESLEADVILPNWILHGEPLLLCFGPAVKGSRRQTWTLHPKRPRSRIHCVASWLLISMSGRGRGGGKILSEQRSWLLAKAEKTSGTPIWIS